MKPALTLLTRLMAQPWAVRRDALSLFTRLTLSGEATTPRRDRAQLKNIRQRADYQPLNDESGWAVCDEVLPEVPTLPQGLKVLLPWGVLGRAWTECEKYYMDAVDVDSITEEISETPEGSTVVLWFRSPGGITTGIPETAAALRQFSKSRRLIAFTDALCCSAAYWLAAQCESIHATPTADVGSIGVYVALYDFTEWMKQQGIALELFKAGSMKGMGIEGNPLSDEEAAYLQERVDESYDQFIADVTRNRAIEDSSMQGQSLRGKSALAANLADTNWQSASAFFAALGKGKV